MNSSTPRQHWLLRSWWTPVLATLLTLLIVYKFLPLNFIPGPMRSCACELALLNEHQEKSGSGTILGPAKRWCRVGQMSEFSERQGVKLIPGTA